jgi:peptidoglycan biosynthesis protein MviN/MurJ (putative lipid II flippase)
MPPILRSVGHGLAFVVLILLIGLVIYAIGESRRAGRIIAIGVIVALLLGVLVYATLRGLWAQTCENCSPSSGKLVLVRTAKT